MNTELVVVWNGTPELGRYLDPTLRAIEARPAPPPPLFSRLPVASKPLLLVQEFLQSLSRTDFVPMATIGSCCCLTRATVQYAVEELRRRGLLDRSPEPVTTDSRVYGYRWKW